MVYAIQANFERRSAFYLQDSNSEWFSRFSSTTDPIDSPPDDGACVAYKERLPGFDEPPAAFGEAFVFFASPAFKDIIETLEPGVHDFVPFELRYGTPKSYEAYQYFYVRPQQFINAVDLEASDLEWIQRKTDGSWAWLKKLDTPMVMKPEMVTGKHLWRYTLETFISKELYDELVRQGMSVTWRLEKQLSSGDTVPAAAE